MISRRDVCFFFPSLGSDRRIYRVVDRSVMAYSLESAIEILRRIVHLKMDWMHMQMQLLYELYVDPLTLIWIPDLEEIMVNIEEVKNDKLKKIRKY
ncbi:unnamed protein product [Lactuca virosa]|uniref:Uncharacterized protein n=1 Tax=Lactuca virosa TaxID=75947 RepID=A0AAU9LK34_9ASTR|nr:unnamed protein product [Lactuca virosa]